MKYQVTMDGYEWEQEKKRIEDTAKKEGSTQGFWEAIALLEDVAMHGKHGNIHYGKDVTKEQKERFEKLMKYIERGYSASLRVKNET